jgi:hypothetical protein
MKRILFTLATAAVVTLMLSSCAATKKDCQGNKHYRLKNGIYL